MYAGMGIDMCVACTGNDKADSVLDNLDNYLGIKACAGGKASYYPVQVCCHPLYTCTVASAFLTAVLTSAAIYIYVILSSLTPLPCSPAYAACRPSGSST
jgi:hypothetical protein